MLKVDDRIKVTGKRMGINGEGIAYYKKKVVFVEGLIHDEEAEVIVTEVTDRYIKAKVNKIFKKSDARIKSKCRHFDRCGGCSMLHIDYESQLDIKDEILEESLEKYSTLNLHTTNLIPIIGMENPYNYRNKAQLPIQENNNNIYIGLYELDSNRIVPMDDCIVQNEVVNKIFRRIKELIEIYKVPVSSRKDRKGLRYLVVRKAHNTDDIQVTFISYNRTVKQNSKLVKILVDEVKNIKTIAENINSKKNSNIFGPDTKIIYGQKTINDSIADVNFKLEPRDFYQLNPEQAEVLYELVKEALVDKEIQTLLDLYCGVGTIGQYVAKGTNIKLRGVDTIPSAIESAKENAKLNGIKKADYEIGKAEHILPKWAKKGYRPDAIIVDPPRKGLDDILIFTLMKMKPKYLIYVSCNPATLAKNLADLSKYYYVESIQPVDMFPHTAHVESVTILKRK